VTNTVACSVEAYVEAINALLAEAHWAGATDAMGAADAVCDAGRRADEVPARSVEYDDIDHEPSRWFER
jgi:hypothetical protein